MSLRNKIASGLLYIVSFICVVFAVVYLFTPAILPYHVKFLGKTHDQLDPKTGELFIFAFRIIGGATLSIGITLAILVKNIFTGRWIKWTIFIMMTIMLSTCEYVMLSVGTFTPWWVLIITFIILCAGLLLIKPEEN